jgi:hypothetical protein
MAHSDEQPMRNIVMCFGSLDFVFDDLIESPAGVMFSQSQPDTPTPPKGQPPEESRAAKLLTVKIRQPSHEFTFGVGISFIPYPLVLTPVV